MRVALVPTGLRGINMWGRALVRQYPDEVRFVALCDINTGRLAFAKEYIGADCPTCADFDRKIRETTPDTVIVTSMQVGCDVITEKSMTTDADMCQAILDAQALTCKNLTVTFNYRYSPHRQRMKELHKSGRIGKVTSVDLHRYLDVYLGASYYRS